MGTTREIKFRAWDTKQSKRLNEMVYFGLTDMDGDLIVLSMSYIDSETIVQQYTGLKDKSGKEIYEGDVVYLAGYGDYEVEWPFVQLYQSAWEDDIGDIKGNIYENPELLEGGSR